MKVNWRLVRGLGNLQLLNRASMGLIVSVPVIASIWPKFVGWFELKEDELPDPWGLLFFASLAILAARTIYELRCPETVRDIAIDDYVVNKKTEYKNSPTENGILDAITVLETSGRYPQELEMFQDTDNQTEKRKHKLSAERDTLKGKIEEIDKQHEELRKIRYGGEVEDPEESRRLESPRKGRHAKPRQLRDSR